jgi:hypothetical protein
MNIEWLTWSNPVSIWWCSLLVVSGINVTLWLLLSRSLRRTALRLEVLVLLSAAYVFGCAFRSVLPRADVQRICLFDTWLSSVFVGRSVATVAEICFVVQWAIVLRYLGESAQSGIARRIANVIVPLVLVAEFCSWYAVITTSYLGNAVENSLWAVTFLLIAAALLALLNRFAGIVQLAIGAALVGILGYVAFMFTVDVPMYVDRWLTDAATGKQLLGLFAGLHDAATRWVVTHDMAHWNDEIAWMSLYFSLAVWTSLALCAFALIKNRLPEYRAHGTWSPPLAPRLRPVEVTDGGRSIVPGVPGDRPARARFW